MKQCGVLNHEHQPPGGCKLSDDCLTKGKKVIKVIKLNLNNAPGACEGEELDLRGDWCDLCLKMGPISVVRFTCLNEKCRLHGRNLPFNLCCFCDEHGTVKCPFSEQPLQYIYPGVHKYERGF